MFHAICYGLANINNSLDPEPAKAYILGEANSTQIVSLKQAATVRCLAGGHPKPFVSWWKGTDLLPYKSTRFEVTQDFSLVFNQVELTDLGPYICQAYSGSGKPVSRYVTLRAIGPVHTTNEQDRPYLKYIIDAPTRHVVTPNYIPRPTPQIPFVYEEPPQQPQIGKLSMLALLPQKHSLRLSEFIILRANLD